MKRLTTCVAVAACLPLTTFAQTERDLDSHEHGAALLNVALDDGQLFIELESPWNNLVGFEHEPETEEQQQLFDAAGELLENPAELFGLDAGNCSITSSTIESGIELEHSDDHDDDHGDEHTMAMNTATITMMTMAMSTATIMRTTPMRNHTQSYWLPTSLHAHRYLS